eukprot:TRINITY_DN639_c2_g1_i10.p2 TRINITY_DN639_c2_g1~~TRINITY_DN639_c2_g1_i10.p2  ORF type:complete len:113 (-),score=20.39 TRINITY_DN639_c2_g1_i10:845-1183(-)
MKEKLIFIVTVFLVVMSLSALLGKGNKNMSEIDRLVQSSSVQNVMKERQRLFNLHQKLMVEDAMLLERIKELQEKNEGGVKDEIADGKEGGRAKRERKRERTHAKSNNFSLV